MDVTAAKQAEEALRRSESYLAEAQRLRIRGVGPGADRKRRLASLRGMYRIYGFDPKEGLVAWEKRLQRMHPEDRAKWRETADRAIGKRRITKWNFRILLPDGTVKLHSHRRPSCFERVRDVVQSWVP